MVGRGLGFVENSSGVAGQLVSIGTRAPKTANKDTERIRHDREHSMKQERPAERAPSPTGPQLCSQQAPYLQRLESSRYQQRRGEHDNDAREMSAMQAANHPADRHEHRAGQEHERDAVIDPQDPQHLRFAPQRRSPLPEERPPRFFQEWPAELKQEEQGGPAEGKRA